MCKNLFTVGQMAQQLRVLVALVEDLKSVLSTHVVAHYHPQLQFQGNLVLSYGCGRHQAHI